MDALHRDRVLRAWFTGCDWNENAEFQLARRLVAQSATFFTDYPLVFDDEWEFVPTRPTWVDPP